MLSLRKRRQLTNLAGLSLCVLAMAFGLFWLVWILFTLIVKGFSSLHLTIFTEMTPPPGSEGGLLNAIFGSLLLCGLATLIGTPLGILAGTYLAEFGKESIFARVTRFVNQSLLSAPSVIIGFFVYSAVVVRMRHFSGFAGVLALAIILVPIVAANTENMLALVPAGLREAAAALGAPRWKIVSLVTWRAAKQGILTGVLLAIARISGETAPLLFTALNNQFWSTDLGRPMANLPSVIFQFAMSPYEDWQHLAWGGAILITASVLFLNVCARFSMQRNVEHS